MFDTQYIGYDSNSIIILAWSGQHEHVLHTDGLYAVGGT